MTTAPITSISVDERGVAYIAGTRIKVRHVAIASSAGSQTAQQIQEAYPHLSLAQIYAALAYYHEHKPAIDAEIAADDAYAEHMRQASPNPWTRAQLEARQRSKADPESDGDNRPSLAQLYAGQFGRIEGSGEPYSEDTGRSFTEYVVQKHRDGRL